MNGLTPLEKVAAAVRVCGFGKFATAYLRLKGEEAPETWDLASTLQSIGVKVASDELRARRIRQGVEAFRDLCPGVKTASPTNFTAAFHAVNQLTNGLSKTASAGHRDTVAQHQMALWTAMKVAAEREADPCVGLAKIALRVWDETRRIGEKVASTREEREAFAASFASNYRVDQKVAALRASGAITEREATKLAYLSAEAALDDLGHVVKLAYPAALTDPRVVGAAIGSVGGAVLGAWDDDNNRLRGAAMGGMLGVPVGAVGGQVVHEIMAHRAANALAKLKEQQHAEELFNRLHEAAGRIGAGVLQPIYEGKQKIVDHFAAGNKNLPLDVATNLTVNDIDQLAQATRGLGRPVV